METYKELRCLSSGVANLQHVPQAASLNTDKEGNRSTAADRVGQEIRQGAQGKEAGSRAGNWGGSTE